MDFEKACEEQKIKYLKNEPMKNHTTFKTGGPADYLVNVASLEELKEVILLAKQTATPFMVLGKGSNILVSDKGIEGAVISLCKMDEISVNGNVITAKSGASLASVCMKALEASLTGLEFAYGIPGTVGGGLYMNAGAYSGEMSQVVLSAKYIDLNGNFGEISNKDMKLGYRTSLFKQGDKIITEVTFLLKQGKREEIKALMDDFLSRRRDKQPLEYPSAGSTFKRPQGYFAGALIEKCSLKGLTIGGAMVSKKHAGFIVNIGNATSRDILELINTVQATVMEKEKVMLDPEVIFVGRK